jgi:hypothetical protein
MRGLREVLKKSVPTSSACAFSIFVLLEIVALFGPPPQVLPPMIQPADS